MAAHLNTTVDDAIVRVLQAEQAARDAVAQCAADAERVRQESRARARAIAERAAERVARVHRWTDGAIRERVELLNQQRAALQQSTPADPAEPSRLATALELLAAELSSDRAST